MCGITGIAYSDGRPVQRDVLESMTAALRHRGPDDEGIQIIGNAGMQAGLGHRRLSIIDLSPNGRQPMCNEDGTVWLTFNGEIYNFRELKSDLVHKGHCFSSNTDSEVIIHGYEEYGPAFFSRMNGMFAFGIWDCGRQRLILCRDRYGKKPLYYWKSAAGIVFASELKALLKHPDLKRELDIENLSRYLLYEYVPAPYSIFKNVQKLLPGHYLTWRRGAVHSTAYWEIHFNGTNTVEPLAEHEICERLVSLLQRSVERRLMSDVPLGVFLSGGIDSSSIVALMSRLVPAEKIKTFSIGFEEKSFDESRYAQEVARHFGTDHHEQVLTPGTLVDIIPDVWDFMDEPFADASVIPTYLLSRFTRQHVTVALGGDGGDELFAGYDPFVAHAAARYYEMIPRCIRNHIIGPLVHRLPVSTENMSLDFKMKQFLKGMPYEPAVRNQVWLGSFSAEEQRSVLHPDIRGSLNGFTPYRDLQDACRSMHFRDPVDRLIYLYSRFYLGEDILTKVDRASMAVSLEVRSPFLDVEFAEFVNTISSRLKLHGLSRKYILKKSLEKIVPDSILYRRKKGFGIPVGKWFSRELKPMLLDVFSPSRIRREGIFEPRAIEHLVDDHVQGRRDNRKQLWSLLMFEMWKERFAG